MVVDQLMDNAVSQQFSRLPPHSLEAEMCLLASMMLEKDVVGQAVQIVDRDAFFQADHQVVYDVLVKLYEQNRPIDAVILCDELAKRQLLEEIGGQAYIGQILNTVPSAAHGEHYAKIVREKALLRQLISASNDILRESYAPHESAELVLDKAEKRIFEIASKKVSGSMSAIADVLHEVFETIESRGQRGLETGFYELDDMMNGLQNGEMVIVAARPSMGKAQPLDAKVLTTSGWSRIGDLGIGDELASIDGKTSQVIGIFPQGERQVYRVTFADGRSAECCDEHLWRIYGSGSDRARVVSTAKIRGMLAQETLKAGLSIDRFDGTFGTDARLPIDPWLLGILLGNNRFGGVAGHVSAADLGATPDDAVAVAHALQVASDEHGGPIVGWKLRPDWYGGDHAAPQPLTTALQVLGLADCTETTAFVPVAYRSASRDGRLRLLHGLIGRDDVATSFDSTEFVTRSGRLATDVVDLARSLGGVGRRHVGGDGSYRCEISGVANVANRRLNVVSIEPSRITATQCIAVTHPSRLYVTDDYVVTHNTAFAMNLIEHISADSRQATAVFSLEMSKQQLAQRMLCSRGAIDAHKLRKGMLQAHEYAHLANVVGELAKAPIWVDDSPGLTPMELRAKCRRLKLQHDVKCIMIDYMQLMDNPGVESRQQQISEISRGIKAVARELNVPVIALSQLNRGSENRGRPQTADERPARVGVHRAGCGRDHAAAPRGLLPDERAGLSAGQHRRDHHRQAAERADGDGQADVPEQGDAVRELVDAGRPVLNGPGRRR